MLNSFLTWKAVEQFIWGIVCWYYCRKCHTFNQVPISVWQLCIRPALLIMQQIKIEFETPWTVSRISWLVFVVCVILKTNVDTEARNICLQGRSPVKWRSNLISSGCNWYHHWQLYKTFDGIVCSCLVFPSSPSQPHSQAGQSHKGAAGWCYRPHLNSLTTIKSKSKHTWSIFYKFRLKNNQTIWKWLFYNPKEC